MPRKRPVRIPGHVAAGLPGYSYAAGPLGPLVLCWAAGRWPGATSFPRRCRWGAASGIASEREEPRGEPAEAPGAVPTDSSQHQEATKYCPHYEQVRIHLIRIIMIHTSNACARAASYSSLCTRCTTSRPCQTCAYLHPCVQGITC